MRWYFVPQSTLFDFSTTNYCPQTVPDYTINYTINYTYTTTNYCPQTVPDYSFAQSP